MSARYLILIVEDNLQHAETLKRTIQRLTPEVDVIVRDQGFAKVLEELPQHRPDVFIVDLYEGEYAPENLEGPELCKQIWHKRFRPLIIHSAFDADPHVAERLAKHPCYKYISKGPTDSADQVAAQVKDFLIHASAFRKVEDEVDAVLQTVMQDTAETIWVVETDPAKRSNALLRSARRRVGAMMDRKPLLSEESLFPWEQYIVPPLEPDLLNGDVLRLKDADPMSASSYRLVLSPSCDLVRYAGKAKIDAILVGKCVDLLSFFNAAQLRKADGRETVKKQLLTILTQAQTNGYCLLPAYPSLWPDMAVKLRDIKFVTFEDVFGESSEQKLVRVASVDSPFREQISWAYMQIASRPGLPDREIGTWADSILNQVGL